MLTGKSSVLVRFGSAFMRRGHLMLAGGLMLVMLMFAGTQANADRVVFRFTGGEWSHSRHGGWHRYWGGPSIGFYYASEPVYIVSGYDAPSYYTGPDFWYSDPSFGLSLNFGGGGYSGGGYYGGGYSDGGYYRRGDRYEDRGRYYGGDRYDNHDRYPGSDRYSGGYSHSGDNTYSGGYPHSSDRYSGGYSHSGGNTYSGGNRYSGGGARYGSGNQRGSEDRGSFRGGRGR